MWKSKPLWLMIFLIVPTLLTACTDKTNKGVSNAERYLENLAQGHVNTAQEYVCQSHQYDVERIAQSTSSFNGQRGTFAMDHIACHEAEHFVECAYTLSVTVYDLIEDESGEPTQIVLAESTQAVTETYRIENDLVCGVVETGVASETSNESATSDQTNIIETTTD